MNKWIFLFFLFTLKIYAQTDTLQKSFFDNIDLLFAIETGIVNSYNTNKLFDGRKQDGIALKKNVTFNFQPIIKVQAGLTGFGVTFKAYYRGNFFKQHSTGIQENVNNKKIFDLIESFSNYGGELTYNVTDFFICGLQYDDHYSFTVSGGSGFFNYSEKIREPEFRTNSSFSQIKLVAGYNYVLSNVKIISKINFTLYSKPTTNKRAVLLNDYDNFLYAYVNEYTFDYKKNPFNLQFELGAKLDFPIYPFFKYEYLNFDNLYKVHFFSFNLGFQIP